MRHALVLLLIALSPAAAQAQLRSEAFASGFALPLELVQDPVLDSVQYVVEQRGRIRVLVNGVVQGQDFLDLTGQLATGGEQGLLGLAFAPDYATSRRLFVNFTNLAGHTVVARFTRAADDLLRADPASRFDLRWGGADPFIVQPYANHNGGHIEFGPDGFLYIGMGDGGSGGDPQNYAQNPNSLLGKMLRIDVDVPDADPQGYTIPPDNPFVGGGALPEIWAFGYRNPWKFTFDRSGAGGTGTGALVIGDVGQAAFEEIDYEPAGAGGRNYGWRLFEGLEPYLPDTPPGVLPLIDPILVYGRSDGRSVTGGYVYRGAALDAAFVGRYFYADFIFGRVWSVALSIDPATGEATASLPVEHTAELGGSDTIGNISAFGVDRSGELYLVSFNGTIFRILSSGGAPPPADQQFRLTITPPTGGSVLAPGIQCGDLGGSCAIDLPSGLFIGLEAQPAPGFQFTAWTGAADCADGSVTMLSSVTCSATFSPTGGIPPPPPPPPSGTRRLTVVRPTGGTILGPGITCGTGGAACTIDFPAGLVIGLDAVPDAGNSFTGWSPECPGGLVTLTDDRTCSPTFAGGGTPPPPPPPPPTGLRRLTVVRPTGGTILGPGINCGTTTNACVVDFPAGIVIGLDAIPDPGSSFGGWSADCPAGLVNLTLDRTCAPTFTGGTPPPPPPPPPPGGLVRLTIVFANGGTVFGAGIVCGDEGSSCTVDMPAGVMLGLDVLDSPGFDFAGWSGEGCGPVVTLNVDRTCTPSFVPESFGSVMARAWPSPSSSSRSPGSARVRPWPGSSRRRETT